MKIIYITLYNAIKDKPVKLAAVEDLAEFGWLQRGAVREHLVFASRLFVQKAAKGARNTVELKDFPFLCHVHVRNSGLAAVLVSDREYPERVAYTLLDKQMRDFEAAVQDRWKHQTEDQDYELKSMAEDLEKYQNPKEADKIMKIQQNLEDIKEIMHQNIEQVLARGEPLEKLMEKSEDLSYSSKTFATAARKNNQCCKLY